MTLIAGAAAHGSPGVSTALQLIAAQWANAEDVPVVVEADSAGGVLAARYELSLTPGFVTLAESLRKGETPALLDHAQRLPSGVGCVSLSPSATAASAQLRSAGPYLGPYLARAPHPVLLDAGTLLPDGKAVSAVSAADHLLWFVRPTREELLVLRHRLAECAQPERVGIVLVGDTPYNADQVAEALSVEVLHTLPVDARAAMAVNLGGDDRYLRRSQLSRSCSQLASKLAAELPAPPQRAQAVASVVSASGSREMATPVVDTDHGLEAMDADGLTVLQEPATPSAGSAAEQPNLIVWVNDEEAGPE